MKRDEGGKYLGVGGEQTVPHHPMTGCNSRGSRLTVLTYHWSDGEWRSNRSSVTTSHQPLLLSEREEGEVMVKGRHRGVSRATKRRATGEGEGEVTVLFHGDLLRGQ